MGVFGNETTDWNDSKVQVEIGIVLKKGRAGGVVEN
jgi:hypothetical protein